VNRVGIGPTSRAFQGEVGTGSIGIECVRPPSPQAGVFRTLENPGNGLVLGGGDHFPDVEVPSRQGGGAILISFTRGDVDGAG